MHSCSALGNTRVPQRVLFQKWSINFYYTHMGIPWYTQKTCSHMFTCALCTKCNYLMPLPPHERERTGDAVHCCSFFSPSVVFLVVVAISPFRHSRLRRGKRSNFKFAVWIELTASSGTVTLLLTAVWSALLNRFCYSRINPLVFIRIVKFFFSVPFLAKILLSGYQFDCY